VTKIQAGFTCTALERILAWRANLADEERGSGNGAGVAPLRSAWSSSLFRS
jgi:hypothetical protein